MKVPIVIEKSTKVLAEEFIEELKNSDSEIDETIKFVFKKINSFLRDLDELTDSHFNGVFVRFDMKKSGAMLSWDFPIGLGLPFTLISLISPNRMAPINTDWKTSIESFFHEAFCLFA